MKTYYRTLLTYLQSAALLALLFACFSPRFAPGLSGLLFLSVPVALSVWRNGLLKTFLLLPSALMIYTLWGGGQWVPVMAAVMMGLYLGWVLLLDIEPQDILWQGTLFAAGLFLLWLALAMSNGHDPIGIWTETLKRQLTEGMAIYSRNKEALPVSPQELVRIISSLYPSFILLGLAFANALSLAIIRAAMVLWGDVPRPYLPIDLWRIPHPLVWCLIIGIFLVHVTGSAAGEAFYALGLNCMVMASILYSAAGLGIVGFYMRRLKGGQMLKSILIAICILQPLLLQAVIWLGVFDTWFDFRRLETADSPA